MVSGTSTTPLTAEGEIGGVNQSQHQQPQKKNPNFCMAVPGFGSGSDGPAPVAASAVPAGGGPSASFNTGSSSDDLSKKIRKPYTITKSRESWTEQEHDKFLEALQLFDRDWKKIEAFVGSKTVIQIRSHAQKYFLKVQKNGTSEHVPPPRPKRKAAHPYPQKASKIVPPFSQTPLPCQASPSLVEPRYATRTDPSSVLRNSTTGATAASWTQNSVPPHTAPESSAKDDIGLTGSLGPNNSCSSSDSPSRLWPTSEATDQANHAPSHHVMPDFAQVYGFIGSVFDPNTSGHLQKLKEMDPIDVQTVLLLMRNLAINLRSPDFEDHRTLLSSYDVGSEEAKSFCTMESFHSSEVTNTPIGMKSE